jgi:hypothetical protein
MERRRDRFDRGFDILFPGGSFDAEGLEADIKRKLDGTLWFSPRTERLWFARRWPLPRFGAPGRAGSDVAALSVERLAQTLKFENQRFALRPDPLGIGLVEVSLIVRRTHG